MNSNVVRVAKSPLASARAAPVQFVISPRAILRRALHIAGNLNVAQHRNGLSKRSSLNPNTLAAAYADESYILVQSNAAICLLGLL